MKHLRKVITLMLAAFMALAVSVPALAADPTGSITIKPVVTDPNADTTNYDAYKIFDMTTTGDKNADGKYTAVSYTINSDWAGFFAAGAPGAGYIVDTNTTGTLNQIAVNGATKYINITDSNVAAFAKAAFEYAQKNTTITYKATVSVAKNATEAKFENLALGYYMVYPRGASVNIDNYTSIVSLTSTNPDAEIAQKAKYPTLEKEADDISVEVGQKVTYTLKSKVPDTTGYIKYEMTFADKTTDGLTFDGVDSIKVKIGGTELAATDYTVSTTAPDFSVTIDMLKEENGEKVAKYTYDAAIEITYTATVNKDAVTVIDENHATLTYHNNPKNSDDKDTTPPVVVKTYSAQINILKVDGSDKETPLEGAMFVLRCKTPNTNEGDTATAVAGSYYKFTPAEGQNKAKTEWIAMESDTTDDLIAAAEAGTITAVTTDADGKAKFDGLEDGTYELIEIKAPAGYNLLTTPTEVTIAGDPANPETLKITSEIENNSGTELPSTGGMGTRILYTVGGIMLVGGAIALVSKKRAASLEK